MRQSLIKFVKLPALTLWITGWFLSPMPALSQQLIIKFNAKADLEAARKHKLDNIQASFNRTHDIEIKPLSIAALKRNKILATAQNIGIDRIAVLSCPVGATPEQLLSALRSDPRIEYAQFNSHFRVHDLPNDPMIPDQWLIRKIQLEAAWRITLGNDSVIVAVIDTGIDYDHEDLMNNMWINHGESLNGVDDDRNGFIDDIRGWDFTDAPNFPDGGDYLERDNDPRDEHGHGTSVAGIIAATAFNDVGIAGVAPGCRIMNLRAGTSQGYLEEDDVAAAIIYAVDNGAHILNMSFGDVATSPMMRDVLAFAERSGVVLIASAGNSGSAEIHYPSALPQVISVGATSANDGLATFSSYGPTLDLTAPGVNLLTTARGNGYRNFSGTSAAAPVVAGVAALLLSSDPDLTHSDIRNILNATADDLGVDGWDPCFGAGRVNAYRALAIGYPAQATILSPELDDGFYQSPVAILGTASGALLDSYELAFGPGENPSSWNVIQSVNRRQVIEDTLGVWEIDHLAESSYILRLRVINRDGTTAEHSTRIFIDRTPPQLLSFQTIPMFDGYQRSHLIEFETDDLTRASIFHRTKASQQAFQQITLDYEVRTQRYLFIEPGDHELYFRLINKSGLSAEFNNSGSYYGLNLTDPVLETSRFVNLGFLLPPLYALNKVVDFDGDGNAEILGNPLTPAGAFANLTLFEFINGEFQSRELLPGIFIPRDIGDSNGDGRQEILAGHGPNSFIFESNRRDQPPQELIWADSTEFWACRFADLDQDGKIEIIGRVGKDYQIREYIGNGQYELKATLTNPTSGANLGGVPHVEIGDFDGDQQMEILIGDSDGDIFIYECVGDDWFELTWQQRLPLVGAINYLASGDFNGDGQTDFAVGCHSSPELDLEHEYDGRYWLFRIYSGVGDNDFQVVWEEAFFGFANPADFASSVTAGDIDNDGRDELLINVFPDFYVVEWEPAREDYVVSGYFNPSRTHANVIGDFDGDGYPEFLVNTGPATVALQDRYLSDQPGPAAPAGFQVNPLDERQVLLRWLSVADASHYRIYRGANADSLEFLENTFENCYIDSAVIENQSYWYAVSAGYPQVESQATAPIMAIPGRRPFCVSAWFLAPNQVRMRFSEPMDASINKVSAYVVSPESLQISSAVDARSGEEVLLTLDSKTVSAGDYTIAVKEVFDRDRTPIDTTRNLALFSVLEKAVRFFVVNAEIVAGHKIALNFNLPVDPLTGSDEKNYIIEPEINIEQVALSSARADQVVLSLAPNNLFVTLGMELVITVKNVFSATGGVPLQTGQGSQASVSWRPHDLSQIFSYPNPCKVVAGDEKITFVNLTRYVVVKILTPSGKLIRTLKSTDNSRRLSWDLKTERGEEAASGIYVFLVENETERRTGKLAIIR